MERHRVDSTNIARIGYDPETRTLEIEFKNGAVYQYPAVPPDTWERFLKAPSKGSFFHEHIRPSYTGKRKELVK